MMVRGLSTSFLSIRLFFSRAHEKWHETKRKQLFFSETTPSPSRCDFVPSKGETLFVVFSSYNKKPREQILIERCVLKWNTCTPADEGRTKAAKKHVLSFCFLLFASFSRSRLFKASFFSRKSCWMLSFSFLSHVSHVSLLCFLKKWPKIDLFWAVFFTQEIKSVFYHKTTLKRPVLYISL